MRRPPTQGRAKQSYSHEASPVNNSYRKEVPLANLFQIPDLNPKLKVNAKFTPTLNTSSHSKAREDMKLTTTNVFINNLNIQIKPQIGARTPGVQSTKARGDSASRKNKQSPLRINYDEGALDANDLKDSLMKNYIPYGVLSSKNKPDHENFDHQIQKMPTSKIPTPKTSKHDLASLLGRNENYTSPQHHTLKPYSASNKDKGTLQNKTLYNQFGFGGHRTPDTSTSISHTTTKKHDFRSPNRMLTPYEAALARKNPKNQKSFDINSLMQMDVVGTRPQTGTQSKLYANSSNNSPREIQQDVRRSKPNESEIFRLLHEANNNIRQATLKPNVKAPSVDRHSKHPSTSLAASYLDAAGKPKHKKAPSFDVNARNSEILAKSLVPNFERSRQSVDGIMEVKKPLSRGTDSRRGGKPRFTYSLRTRAGANHLGQRKTNQDSYIAVTNIGDYEDRHLFGVCDGHGLNGHFASGFVKELLPELLVNDPTFDSDPKKAFVNSYELCNQRLIISDIDVKFSGTTSVSVLLWGDKIITANAGDSRAVMGRVKKGGVWDFNELSTDHKPNSIGEAQRILKQGGRIEPFRDMEGNFVGPSRVWLMDQDIPGLAMSRSIGDMVAASVGVSCIPEIKEFTITPEDKFMVIASDGVWEFLENIDIVKMIGPYYEKGNIEGACDLLLSNALRRWQEEEENVVDDITLIIIFF